MVTWALERSSRMHRVGTNQKIIDRIEETGHQWVEMQIVPFERSVVGGDPVLEGPVVAYGSTAIHDVARRNGWVPGVWESKQVAEPYVAAALGPLYMNTDIRVVPARDAVQVALEQGWEWFFVKPETDAKLFAGTVTDPQKYPFFIEAILANQYIPEEFNVCVSSIKQIGIEWRIPVVAGRVADYSIYRQYRRVMLSREIYQDVLDLAEEAIRLHNPAPAYVIDIGQINGGLKIIEYNGFNSSGLYACNIANVVDAINKMVERDYEIGRTN